MATKAYRLTFLLRLAGSDVSTTQQTVMIAAKTTDEAVGLAQFYRTGLPSQAIIFATLTDASGAALWSERAGSAPDTVSPQEDQP